jgi:hypothetical protein
MRARLAESRYRPPAAGLNLERAMQSHPDVLQRPEGEPNEQFAVVDATDRQTAESQFGADFDDEAAEANHG